MKDKRPSFSAMKTRMQQDAKARARAHRRAIVDKAKKRRGAEGKADSEADRADLETDRGIRKHRSRMKSDKNYARAHAKRKQSTSRVNSQKASSSVWKAIKKSRLKGNSSAASKFMQQGAANQWWNKV